MIAVGQAFSLRERASRKIVGPYLAIAPEHTGWVVINLDDGRQTWMSERELSDEWLDVDGSSYYVLDERLF